MRKGGQAGLVVFSLLLTACGGGGSGTDGGTTPDGSTGSDGGDGGGNGACTASAMPNVVVQNFTGYSLSVVDQDAYFVEPGPNMQRGALRHIKLDGTGDGTLIDPAMPGVMLGAAAVGSDIFYFQEDDAQSSKIHMYRSPRATGGVGTQVGTATYPGFGANIVGGGLAGIEICQSCGVFAQRGTDIFVNDGATLSRVSTTSGTKTVLANAVQQILWPTLVGSTIYYKDTDGAIYSTSADAMMPSGARIGTATCGSGRTLWMSAYAGGFFCGELFGIDKVDIMGMTKTHVIYTLMDPNPTQFNPSAVDGTNYYALPKSSAKSFPIYRVDATSGALTPLACDARAIVDYKMTATDIVYVELRQEAMMLSLRRVAR